MNISFKGDTYETHPAADLFPMMEGEELQNLADDIKANGQRQPIVLYVEHATAAPVVLDGRNRLRACEMAGVLPTVQTITKAGLSMHGGAGSPLAYVVSQNVHRRHLDASQRAMIGAALMPMLAAEAKARQRAAGGALPAVRANLPEAGRAREKAAEAVSVSPRLIADAITVKSEAPPEVVEAVKAGKTAVSAAAKATREAQRAERARDDDLHFRRRQRRSGSASRIPANIPKSARRSIPEFSIYLRARFTSTDRVRLGRLLLDQGDAGEDG